ncbi:MAG: hypothetical protein ABW275_00395 [Hansschlegelia sp.]
MTRRASCAGTVTAALVVAVSVAAWLAWMRGPVADPPGQGSPPAAGPLRLYCQFYVFTEQRPRVGFLFAVEHDGPQPSFRQLSMAEDNGQRADYEGVARPEWRLDTAAQPPRIQSTITVADASQTAQHQEDIAIELYRYDAARDSLVWFEASLKNVSFQNLPGKCRQSAT